MPWVGLQGEIVVFPDHTHLLFSHTFNIFDIVNLKKMDLNAINVQMESPVYVQLLVHFYGDCFETLQMHMTWSENMCM